MTTIKLRRGLAALWTSVNPILSEGEMGVELDTRKFKFGDGVKRWRDLPYAGDTSELSIEMAARIAGDDALDVRLDALEAASSGFGGGGNQISAGTQLAPAGSTVLFSNANGVTFGLSNSSVLTASVAAAAPSPVNFSAGTTSNDLGSVVFSNSNGVSFGLNGSTITGAHNGLTSQSNQAFSAAGGSSAFQTLSFNNANGVSFSNNAGAVEASVATSLTNIRVSAGITSNLLSAVTFSNSNGVSFGLDASTITASIRGELTFSAGTLSAGRNSIVFSDSNGISFGMNGSTITGSHNALTSQTNQQMTMFATGNTTQSSTGTTNASSIIFRGEGVASVGITGGSVVISVPAGGGGLTNINVSAGTTSQNLSNLVFSNSNGVTFGLNGSTVTASVAAGGGGGATLSRFEVAPIITGTAASSHAPASWWFNPFYLTAPLTFSNIWVMKSLSMNTITTSSGVQSINYTHGVTIFNRVDWSNSSTQLTTVTTASFGITFRRSHTGASHSFSASWVTNTTGGTSSFSTTSAASNDALFFNSNRMFAIPCVSSLSAGEYFIAHRHSSTTGTTGQNSTLASFSNIHIAPQSVTFKNLGISVAGQSSSSAMPGGIGFGIASAVTTTTTMAASVISAQTQQYWYANFVNLSKS